MTSQRSDYILNPLKETISKMVFSLSIHKGSINQSKIKTNHFRKNISRIFVSFSKLRHLFKMRFSEYFYLLKYFHF